MRKVTNVISHRSRIFYLNVTFMAYRRESSLSTSALSSAGIRVTRGWWRLDYSCYPPPQSWGLNPVLYHWTRFQPSTLTILSTVVPCVFYHQPVNPLLFGYCDSLLVILVCCPFSYFPQLVDCIPQSIILESLKSWQLSLTFLQALSFLLDHGFLWKCTFLVCNLSSQIFVFH